MKKHWITLFSIILLCGIAILGRSVAQAHELTPTYPTFKNSYVDGVMVTTLKLFNRRTDVSYYEIGVFDEEWKPLPFASADKIVKLEYLKIKYLDIYVKSSDLEDIEYVCTTSKLKSDDIVSSGLSSRICSKVK